MTNWEKNVYRVAVLLIIGICLFPPWHVTVNGMTQEDFGYSFLTHRPDYNASINFGKLALQVFVVGIAAFGLAKLTK